MTFRFTDLHAFCKMHSFALAMLASGVLTLLLCLLLADPSWAAGSLPDIGKRTYTQTSGFGSQIFKAVLIVGSLWYGLRGRWGALVGFMLGMCVVGVAVFGADGLSTLMHSIGNDFIGS